MRAQAPNTTLYPGTLTLRVANAGGGDAAGASATDDIPVAADACPNGWASAPLNPERADGCTLLDLVWAGEPFADQAAFVGKVDEVAAGFPEVSPAAVVASIKAPTEGPDNSCSARIALTFDDGPSVYRSQTLAQLRAKGVPVTFFDVGMRLEANPQLSRFELADGHTVLGHSFDHPNLNSIPASVLAFEVTETAARFVANGAPYSFNVLRPPFLSVNAATTAALAAMGFTVTPNPISATDWDPARSAAQIRDGIVNALRPGVAILLHDGPVDSRAGQATVDAVPLIVDAARARGLPATLSLTLGAPATFGVFAPGVSKDYVAATNATVTSSAGDAALTASDPGHLANGSFTLPLPLEVALAKSAWDAPAANDAVAITFKQRVEATDALRTGAYSNTLTFTLSTTSP